MRPSSEPAPTVGAMFAGSGGLELAVADVFPDARLAWVAEIEPAPARILAHHWPDVPNLGDVTTVDWAAVEPVDIITGGSPCQDLSTCGRGAGMRPGTRSGLWSSMAHAIDAVRPRLVIWENVRGALSATAASGLEPCPGCVGDPDDGQVSEHSDVYSETWPTSGMTRGGTAYELPTWEQRTAGSGSSSSRLLLPTPRATSGGSATEIAALPLADYRDAIARAEQSVGRTAPEALEPERNGEPLLSPRFVEWLMMLPDGWVTDVPGLSRPEQLRALGNGVVPAQAAAALRAFIADEASP